jgi:hypothetical protein
LKIRSVNPAARRQRSGKFTPKPSRPPAFAYSTNPIEEQVQRGNHLGSGRDLRLGADLDEEAIQFNQVLRERGGIAEDFEGSLAVHVLQFVDLVDFGHVEESLSFPFHFHSVGSLRGIS